MLSNQRKSIAIWCLALSCLALPMHGMAQCAAQPFSVSLISSHQVVNGRVSFCQPTETVDFTAVPTPNVGPDAAYAFYRNGVLVQAFSANSLYMAPLLSLNDGDIVKVVLASKVGCFTNDSAEATLQMDAYTYPNDSIYSHNSKICEKVGNIKIELNLKTDKNNDGKFYWYKNGTFTGVIASSLLLSRAIDTGEYSVKIGSSLCPDTDSKNTVTVKIYETAKPYFEQNPVVIQYKQNISVPMPKLHLGLRDESLLKEFHWSTTEWLEGTNTLQPSIHPIKEGKEIEYELTLLTGEVGGLTCESKVKIRVINMIPFLIPNAFSPNNDGRNDVWEIEGIAGYPQSQVKIFNRWGAEMYSSTDGYKTAWNGQRDGETLPIGTYYYTIDLRGSFNNTDRTETGSLTIVR